MSPTGVLAPVIETTVLPLRMCGTTRYSPRAMSPWRTSEAFGLLAVVPDRLSDELGRVDG